MRNRKGTYTLTTSPENYEDEALLKEKMAFERDYDTTPFYFSTNSRDEVNNAMDVLEEYGYHSPWTLVKK